MKTFYFYQSIKIASLIIVMHQQYVHNLAQIDTKEAFINHTNYLVTKRREEADLRVVKDHKFLYAAMWFFLMLFIPMYMFLAPLRHRVYKKRAKYLMTSGSPTKEIAGIKMPGTESKEAGVMADMLLGGTSGKEDVVQEAGLMELGEADEDAVNPTRKSSAGGGSSVEEAEDDSSDDGGGGGGGRGRHAGGIEKFTKGGMEYGVQFTAGPTHNRMFRGSSPNKGKQR
jgi:hypothetical protein